MLDSEGEYIYYVPADVRNCEHSSKELGSHNW